MYLINKVKKRKIATCHAREKVIVVKDKFEIFKI